MRTLCLVMVLALCAGAVVADGCLLRYNGKAESLDFADETAQQAFINYENGVQKMILSVGFKNGGGNGAVWIFPVPANPSEVELDVVKGLPRMKGEEISVRAKAVLNDVKAELRNTQVYPYLFTLATKDEDYLRSLEELRESNGIDAIAYKHVESEGVVSEVVSAETGDALFAYLKRKGLNVKSGDVPVLDGYTGRGYSFVVSWLGTPEGFNAADYIRDNADDIYFSFDEVTLKRDFPRFVELVDGLRAKYPDAVRDIELGVLLRSRRGREFLDDLISAVEKDPSIIANRYGEMGLPLTTVKGLFVSFPAEEMYFPLVPTSVYGEKTVPIDIRVMGYVTPVIFKGIEGHAEVGYYLDESDVFGSGTSGFYSGSGRDLKYTKITIRAPSRLLTEDLRIVNSTPREVNSSNFVLDNALPIEIAVLVLSSIISGLLVGMVVFRDLRKKPWKLALLGLTNCLTLVFTIVTITAVGTKREDDESVKPLLDKLMKKGYFVNRGAALGLYFLAAFFVLFVKYCFIVCILPLGLVAVGMSIGNIREEDRELFEDLREAGYSSWSFKPVDGMKGVFVAAFSACFMLLSWGIIELVKLMV